VEDVRNDVRQGYVSVEDAEELYGVVIEPGTFIVDEAATARLRAKRQPPELATKNTEAGSPHERSDTRDHGGS
jgi:hypothetical protein